MPTQRKPKLEVHAGTMQAVALRSNSSKKRKEQVEEPMYLSRM